MVPEIRPPETEIRPMGLKSDPPILLNYDIMNVPKIHILLTVFGSEIVFFKYRVLLELFKNMTYLPKLVV